MIGVICAGGEGTRLFPLTISVSKHLLPIFDKPMICYPLSLCMLAGCTTIVCVVNKHDLNSYELLFQGLALKNVQIEFVVQPSANGIIGAVIAVAENHGLHDMMVVLGDNIMFGSSLIENLKSAKQDMLSKQKSIIFSVPSSKPEEFGVLKYGEDDQPIDIVEKPTEFLSNDVVPGIYFYKYEHLRDLDKIKKSARGELEVSDFNRQLLYSKRVEVRFLGRGVTWLDCGSFQNLVDASLSVSLIQRHSNQNIGDVNEIDNLIGHNW